MKRRVLPVFLAVLLALVALPALAGPRSGGSFGGRIGFRSSPGSFAPRYTPRPSYGGGGSHFVFLPSFGWGWGGYGYGGGVGLLGTLFMLGVVGVGAVVVLRALRRVRESGGTPWGDDYEEDAVAPGRAYVYKVQLALGRSARGIQERLARFAGEGDTATEAGLASLLQQTALELMREKDSIRYGGLEAAGPMSMTNGETKLSSFALAERSRFQVERVRGTEGQVRRADTAATEGAEALEYVVVTVVVATRAAIDLPKEIAEREQVDATLAALGGVPPDALLGLEVVWTPADPQDSLTETDLLTTYPQLRGV